MALVPTSRSGVPAGIGAREASSQKKRGSGAGNRNVSDGASLHDDAAGEVATAMVDAGGGPGEVGEEHRHGAVQLEVVGKRAPKVGCAERPSVGVADAGSEPERVARAAGGRPREGSREVGHELGPGGAAVAAQGRSARRRRRRGAGRRRGRSSAGSRRARRVVHRGGPRPRPAPRSRRLRGLPRGPRAGCRSASSPRLRRASDRCARCGIRTRRSPRPRLG